MQSKKEQPIKQQKKNKKKPKKKGGMKADEADDMNWLEVMVKQEA